jgi:3-dehydroquinate synthase
MSPDAPPDQPADAQVVPVRLQGHSYEVVIRPGVLAQVGRRLRPLTKAKKVVLVYDENLPEAHRGQLLASLCDDFQQAIECKVPPGEDHKTVATVDRLYGMILKHGIDRGTPVIALGGGVIGDTAGFVAATILRGVPFVQVPTTLLAMVDASVGGKTGVNHAVGKNLVGAFHQPIAVFADPQTLRTLPPRELRGGLAECIKHDVIRDADGFARLEREISRATALDLDYLTRLVAHNVAIKARVVEADPFEKGERAHLNFGHTFGHAIENVSHYEYSHGESVALGMAAACRLAVDLGMLDEISRRRVVAVIEQAGLPTRGMKLDVGAVVDAMAYDKKATSGRLHFVLPDRIGHVVVRDDVPVDAVRRAVESIRD